MDVASPFNDVLPEPLDLIGCDLTEVLVQRFAGSELGAVDKDRVWPRDLIAEVVIVPEQGEPTIFERCRPVVIFAMETGNVLVDQLRRRSVVADDDEYRRDTDFLLFPKLERLRVVAIEGFERGEQNRRKSERVVAFAEADRPFFGRP